MKVADIRPDSVMAGQAPALQKDIDWLAARRESFVHVPCPACGGDATEPLYEKYRMTHVRCPDCATQYVTPRPDAETLGDFYATSANYEFWAKHVFPVTSAARRVQIFRPRAEAVARLAGAAGVSDGTLVEVGAAHGLFCDEASKLGLFSRVIGIEPTPHLADACREIGIETIESTYEKARLDTRADIVASFEVIEHLFDPGAFLRWCHAALKPGGHVLLTCPNIAGFETLILGRESGAVDHEHLNLFTPESLARLAGRSGFTDVRVTTPGRLDVELVQRALDEGAVTRETVGEAMCRLVEAESDLQDRLQALIQDARLSSNMMMTARKPA